MSLDLESAPDKPLPRDVALALAREAKRPTGRPCELTSELATKILLRVAEGSFLNVAAGAAGVSYEALSEWIERAKGDAANGLDTIFVRFGQAYAQAKQEAEANAVSSLQRGGDGKYKDWRAQAWWLERRHKERWSIPKEAANAGVTLALTDAQLGALGEALRVAAAKPVLEVEATSVEVESSSTSPVRDDK